MKRLIYLVSIIIQIPLFLACNHKNLVSIEKQYEQIERLIWRNPDSALVILGSYPIYQLSETGQMHWVLLHELAGIRMGKKGDPDITMNSVIEYYLENNMQSHLARAYYVQGVEYMLNTQYFEALASLKEAENKLCYIPDELPYKSLVYFVEAKIAETEYLYHIAHECYLKSLDCATTINDRYRMACCYYNIARTRSEYTDSLSQEFYQNALDIARDLNDTIFFYEILIQKETHNITIDSTQLYTYARFLTDTMHNPFYAHLVVEYLQNNGQINEAEKYLQICSLDTINSGWSKEHYQYLLSRQENLLGNSQLAYARLENIYLNQIDQICRDGKTKTYTISRMYDVEQEKNKNLKLTIDKQHLWITIGIIIFILIIVILSAIYINYLHKVHEREQTQAYEIEKLRALAAEEQANKEIDRLNMELELKRVMLRDSLKKRIALSRKLAKSSNNLQTQAQNPSAWLQEWLEENTFINGANSNKLIAEFKAIYGNLLGDLKKTHPSLTEKDLLFIALSILGLDVNDMSYIFGTTDRTIWNRRQFVKNRIGNSKMDFDEWIERLRRKDRKGKI